MMMSLIINVALHTPQNRLSETITHITLYTINYVMFLISCGNEGVTSYVSVGLESVGYAVDCFVVSGYALHPHSLPYILGRQWLQPPRHAAAPEKSWILLTKS